jgi:hypothetical protein
MKFFHNIKKTIIISVYLASLTYASSNEDEEISNRNSRRTSQELILPEKKSTQGNINIMSFFGKKGKSTSATSPSKTKISVSSTKNLASSSTTSSSQRYEGEESEEKNSRDKPVSANTW